MDDRRSTPNGHPERIDSQRGLTNSLRISEALRGFHYPGRSTSRFTSANYASRATPRRGPEATDADAPRMTLLARLLDSLTTDD
jgi:hypothetical protein